jgi:hypothetical protein
MWMTIEKGVECMQADIEAYTTEMEVVGTAYEDMQAKNSRLLQQVRNALKPKPTSS